MNKIKIPLISKPIFSTILQIRIYDLNYGNHLGNDSLISLLHEARVQFFKRYSFTEFDVAGVGILITSLVVNYKAEAFYGDNIEIEIGIGETSRASIDLLYSLKIPNGGHEIARAMTTITFFDYNKSKIARVPIPFLEAIKDFI